MTLVGDLLERAARATPAAVEDRETGWWLRHSDNGVWWSGAVLAHGPEDRLVERVEAAERFYTERSAVARFQVCAACPAGLDQVLAERGYLREAPISLVTAGANAPHEMPVPPGTTVRVDASPTPEWLAVLGATSAPAVDAEREARLLRRIRLPRAYVTVLAGGEPVGMGRAVADSGWTGVFHMATTAAARRRGAARLVLSAVARWAELHGASRLYLQVEQSNDAARRLYATAGFAPYARYHYRVSHRRADSSGTCRGRPT